MGAGVRARGGVVISPLRASPAELHAFERAGLGKAPFRFTGVRKNLFVIPGCPDATKPGSSCDLCGTPMTYEFWISSSDGKSFKVGSECVAKTGDAGLRRVVDTKVAQMKRESTHKSQDERAARAVSLLSDEQSRTALSSLPHPNAFIASKGRTLLDWAEWNMSHAGRAGKVKVEKTIRAALSQPARRSA